MGRETTKKQLWGDHLQIPADELNVLYCAGRDVKSLPMADAQLVPYDVMTNLAHAKMLKAIGFLSEAELKRLSGALTEIHRLHAEGRFPLDASREDVHSNVELWLVNEKGIEAGKKIHGGRSRNDQVATDLRMLARDRVIGIGIACCELAETIVDVGGEHLETVMPGFTHHQPAMWCTFAFWTASWTEALLRSVKRMENLLVETNLCPLGSAAGFGTGWSVDREMTARLLAFDGPTPNALDGIASRCEHEAQTAGCFCQLMNQFSNVAQDLILLSHPYFGMLKLDERFVTGSSIMPQKKNPDFAEVIKGKASFALGALTSLGGLQKGAFSGYNRDAQTGKYVLLDLFAEVEATPFILGEVVRTLAVDRERMRDRCGEGFMHASDIADWLAKEKGLAFRDAYNLVAKAVRLSGDAGMIQPEALAQSLSESGFRLEINRAELEVFTDPLSCVKLRDHTGSPSPERVSETLLGQRGRTKLHKARFLESREKIRGAFESLLRSSA